MSIPQNEIKQAFLRCNPKQAITKESEYYVNCDDVRGDEGRKIAFKIAEKIDISDAPGESYAHCLFTGHVGSGKSSEILNAKEILEQVYDYHVIYLNALDMLDINDVYPTDLLFTIAQAVYNDEDIPLPQKLLTSVERWFAEAVYETSEEKEYKAQIEAGMEMDSGIPLLGKLFAKFSGQISKGGAERETIRRQLRKNVSELLRKVNDMLVVAQKQLLPEKKGLVLIIDELEKMVSSHLSDEKERRDVLLFVNNNHLLTELKCHLVCTVPIFLINSQSRTRLERSFDTIFELPVIKVKQNSSNAAWEAGIETLMQIAAKRLHGLPQLENLGLFGGNKELLRQLAAFSGGQVRIFIQLMRNLLSTCRVEQTFPVDQSVLEQVFRDEMRAYDMAIFDDRFQRLAEIAKSKRIRREEADLMDFDMLQQGWVLAYTNREWWYDVVPVIYCLDRFRKFYE